VAGALNSLSSSLARLADRCALVRQGATAVAHASGEIARGNQHMDGSVERAISIGKALGVSVN
jgi:hypothetical protein